MSGRLYYNAALPVLPVTLSQETSLGTTSSATQKVKPAEAQGTDSVNSMQC